MRALITGGAGSFGQAFVRALLADETTEVVRVYSRDENKHARFAEALGDVRRVRFILGDVRDSSRLLDACWGVDTVISAAALKRVDAVSYAPLEVMQTNILGTANVVRAAIERGVTRVLVLSSDKAAMAANPYGVSKAAAEFIAVQMNAQGFPRGTKIAVVRWGNVLGSRGSVAHIWKRQAAQGGPLTLTDERCTRFWITMPQAVAFTRSCLDQMRGGEIFVPKMPSLSLTDLAEALAPGMALKVTGLRPGGEKLHETVVSPEEAARAVELDDRFVIEPTHRTWGRPAWEGEALPEGFTYRSDTNPDWLTVEAMRALLAELPEEVA